MLNTDSLKILESLREVESAKIVRWESRSVLPFVGDGDGEVDDDGEDGDDSCPKFD